MMVNIADKMNKWLLIDVHSVHVISEMCTYKQSMERIKMPYNCFSTSKQKKSIYQLSATEDEKNL